MPLQDFVPTSEYNSLNETIPVSPYAHIHEMVDSQLTTNITQIYWDVTSDVREGVHVMEKILATGSVGNNSLVPKLSDTAATRFLRFPTV